jgi:phosphoribosylformylglycinamidine synthase
VVLGGPAMLIGLGGGAASSVASGASDAELDFASVQRDNPEMQRRCQEVIDRCWQLGDENPIAFIHDVGAGGPVQRPARADARTADAVALRSACRAQRRAGHERRWRSGATRRRSATCWRYEAERLERFGAICRARALSVCGVGEATAAQQLTLDDGQFRQPAGRPAAGLLFGKAPKMRRDSSARQRTARCRRSTHGASLDEAIARVLQLPAWPQEVPDHHRRPQRHRAGARDQMVGPWQVPVADVAVTAASFDGTTARRWRWVSARRSR